MRRSGYSVTRIQRHGYVFILPTLIFFTAFLIYPMISAFQLSFFEWNLISPKVFVGFKNFITLVSDERAISSYLHTIEFSVVSVVAINVLAFTLAIMLNSPLLRNKNLLQSFIFFPVVLSIVAVGVVWEFMFQSSGLISLIVQRIFGASPAWLTDARIAPYSVMIVYVWKSVGFYMVIYIAGLMDVPVSYYEAARIDGAGFWGQMLHITLPSIKNTIALAIVSSVIFTFGTFAIQYVITRGGPSRSTEILALLIFREAFQFNLFGYSAVISVLFFLTLLLFSLVQLRLFKSGSLGA
jgi:multiple sugar transport system permease protein